MTNLTRIKKTHSLKLHPPPGHVCSTFNTLSSSNQEEKTRSGFTTLTRCSRIRECPRNVWRPDSHDPHGRAASYPELLYMPHTGDRRREPCSGLQRRVSLLVQYWPKVQFLICLFFWQTNKDREQTLHLTRWPPEQTTETMQRFVATDDSDTVSWNGLPHF